MPEELREVVDEQVAEPTPPAQVEEKATEQPQTQEQPTPKPAEPAIDFEQRLTEWERKQRAMLDDTLKRIKDSNRSTVENIRRENQRRYQERAAELDGLVAKGDLTEDRAIARKLQLRDELDREELKADVQAQQQWQQHAQRQPAPDNTAFQRKCNRIVNDLGLNMGDQELEELKGVHFDTDDMDEAESMFLKAATKAARKKEKRLEQAVTAKAQQQDAAKTAAKEGAVPMYLGNTTTALPKTPDALAQELEKLLTSPEERDPSLAKARQKRINELSDALDKLM